MLDAEYTVERLNAHSVEHAGTMALNVRDASNFPSSTAIR
jgi:hypothetical protein